MSFLFSVSVYIILEFAPKQKSINFKTVVFPTLFPVDLESSLGVSSSIKLRPLVNSMSRIILTLFSIISLFFFFSQYHPFH